MCAYPFSSWQCKCLISAGCDAGARAAPALLLRGVVWGWPRAWRQGALLAQPQEISVCQKWGEGPTGLWSALRWPCRQPCAPMRAETQTLWAWFLLQLIQLQHTIPGPSVPLPQKQQEVGAAAGCCGRKRGARRLGRVHTRAAVFCGCWLWLCFSACNPSGQINCSRWGVYALRLEQRYFKIGTCRRLRPQITVFITLTKLCFWIFL